MLNFFLGSEIFEISNYKREKVKFKQLIVFQISLLFSTLQLLQQNKIKSTTTTSTRLKSVNLKGATFDRVC